MVNITTGGGPISTKKSEKVFPEESWADGHGLTECGLAAAMAKI
jgi:hypothetical protein